MALAGLGQARLDVFERAFRLLLILDRQAVAIPVGGEGLEQIDGAQISLAKEREGLGVLDVLQMNPVDPLAENLDGPDRVFLGAQEVPRVDAAADLGTVVLDGPGNRVDERVLVPRTVVVDTDGDAVLFDQLVQQVKAVGIGIDRQVSCGSQSGGQNFTASWSTPVGMRGHEGSSRARVAISQHCREASPCAPDLPVDSGLDRAAGGPISVLEPSGRHLV